MLFGAFAITFVIDCHWLSPPFGHLRDRLKILIYMGNSNQKGGRGKHQGTCGSLVNQTVVCCVSVIKGNAPLRETVR